jgi:molybdopterin synthase catalytic subunit
MLFALSAKPLSANAVLKAVGGNDAGAVVTFHGTVRDQARGRRVIRLEYEAYGPMALALFDHLGKEAAERWHGTRLSIHHRLGTCEVGDTTVLIAAASAHRAAAFEACRFAIEQLKAHAPIWKREIYEDGAAWIGQGS